MKPTRRKTKSSIVVPAKPTAAPLLADVRRMIVSAREHVAHAVDAGLALLYWQVGTRIRREVLLEKRADYGKEIVQTLSGQLAAEFGSGFSRSNLFSMVRFAELFPHAKIVQTLSGQLGWSHFDLLLRVDDPLAREFYSEMCRLERWSVRTLREKIDSRLFLRTALSKKPARLARRELAALRDEDHLSPDLVFRDPYVLGFLGLKDTYAEKDLEAAILREMESFILELGDGFSFVARQKRMRVGGVDHYLDLLFFHRHLRRLVAIDLKLGMFTPADKGQMELYLAWLKKHEAVAGENSPLGLILCAGKNDEAVRLLGLDRGDIRVASYLAKALPQKQLERKLHDTVRVARAHLAARHLKQP